MRRVILLVAAPAVALLAWWSGTAPADAQEPGLELVDQTSWVEPGGTFALTLGFDGGAEGATLSADLHPRLLSRSSLAETLDAGGPTSTPIATPVSGPLADVARTTGGDLEMSFPVTPQGIDQEGVYPLEVTVTDAAGGELGSLVTFVVVLPSAEFAPLSVGVILEVGASPGQQPDGTVALEREQMDRIRARASLLEQINGPVSVAPLPETIDALALTDTEDSGAALDRLRAGVRGQEVLARPYVDIDLEAWADAGLITEAPPEAEAGAAVVRSHFGVEPEPHIWLAQSTVGQREASTWRDLGVTGAVLPADAVVDVPGTPDSITPPVQIPDGPPALIPDDRTAGDLVGARSPLEQHRLLATLAMIWFERPAEPRAVLLRIPDRAPLAPDVAAGILNELHASGAVELVTASELFETHVPKDGEQPQPVELQPDEQAEDLSWMPERIDTAKQTIEGLDEVVDDPGLIASLRRSVLIAPGARVSPADRRAHLRYVDDAVSEVGAAVNAPETFRITLTARDGTIPLTLDNDLEEPIAIQVHLESNQLEFPDGDTFSVTVPPGGDRYDLRVRTRTSGGFPLHITLTSPDGEVVLDRTTFDVRSTAISGVGLVLSVGAGLFLVIWWARHWRRSRRDRMNRTAE